MTWGASDNAFPRPTPHTSPAWDWILSGPFPTLLLHPHPCWGLPPDRGRRARRGRPSGRTDTGLVVWRPRFSCRPCCSHTTRPREGLLISGPQGTHWLSERGVRGTQAHFSSGVVGFTWSFIWRGPPSTTLRTVTRQSLRIELRDARPPPVTACNPCPA